MSVKSDNTKYPRNLPSDIDSMAGLPEVFEFDDDELLRLGFRFQQPLIGVKLQGEFSVELMYEQLSTWIFRLLERISSGKPLMGTVLSQMKITMNPNRPICATGYCSELENSFVQDALSKALTLMLARMQALTWGALMEAVYSVILDLEENGIIVIEGSRADIWNAHAEAINAKVARELKLTTAKRNRHWNKEMRRKALRLYEDTLPLLQELKRTYFGKRAPQIQRKNPNLKSWKEVKAEHPELEGILEKLPGYKPRELALLYIGNCLGSASEVYTYRQIKLARADRRRTQKSPDRSSKDFRLIEHSVGVMAKKWYTEHRNVMVPKTLN